MNTQRFSNIIKQHNDTIENIVDYRLPDGYQRDHHKMMIEKVVKYYQNGNVGNARHLAAVYGLVKIFEWGEPLTHTGIDLAARNGHINILEFAVSQDIVSWSLLKMMMDSAAESGHVNVLEWGASQTPKILPTKRGMGMAILCGFLEVLEWGASQTPPILSGM